MPTISPSVSVLAAAVSLAAVPLLSHAETYVWADTASNDIAIESNWSSGSGAPATNFPGDHTYHINNYAQDIRLSSTLNLNGSFFGVGQTTALNTPVHLTVENGGALSVGTLNSAVSINQTETSRMTIQSGGSVTASNGAQIGTRSTGVLDIDSGGTFTVTGDVRLGNHASADGTITNRGSYSAQRLIVSENGGSSRFVHEGGVTLATNFVMYSHGPSIFEVQGSGGSIRFTAASNSGTALLAGTDNGNNATLEWVFDASGVTTIDLTGANAGASIVGTTLNLNIDAWTGSEQVIIDQNGGGLGTTDVSELTVNWTGSVIGSLQINDDGDLVVVPEPGAFAGAAGLLAFVWALRRPRFA
ncbi:MAG: hypothetical protein ACPGIC_07465 [Opitutales bacterium]